MNIHKAILVLSCTIGISWTFAVNLYIYIYVYIYLYIFIYNYNIYLYIYKKSLCTGWLPNPAEEKKMADRPLQGPFFEKWLSQI
jgi:Ca2+/Na+ antiporter